ncbi:C40 family peptidase [Marinoscillum furvescens]|uniref:NlpC/P60 family protein n=1 Tax=Marinoscillum furvescens DSM 4134 TaxID=1122208 RepID=A0A3D9L529_MARFU|nr:C40 family peptidase [Marinoscillum furvescens]RED99729.1 NlpC/P60 family protein [Marinoscillum furvescens DSM 4134]
MSTTFWKAISVLAICVLVMLQSQAQSKRKKRMIQRVVSEAQSYLGAPYQYGGMSRAGIDCSGLMYKCYQSIDVKLPRTAKAQSKTGRKKNWDNVREGDIVFFKFRKKGEKWFHSGIITYAHRGEIRFIHSSTSRGVIESDLNAEYYRDNVKRFRRVIR